jgi:hypothetical protein
VRGGTGGCLAAVSGLSVRHAKILKDVARTQRVQLAIARRGLGACGRACGRSVRPRGVRRRGGWDSGSWMRARWQRCVGDAHDQCAAPVSRVTRDWVGGVASRSLT